MEKHPGPGKGQRRHNMLRVVSSDMKVSIAVKRPHREQAVASTNRVVQSETTSSVVQLAKELQRRAYQARKLRKCSLCGQMGHNRATCKQNPQRMGRKTSLTAAPGEHVLDHPEQDRLRAASKPQWTAAEPRPRPGSTVEVTEVADEVTGQECQEQPEDPLRVVSRVHPSQVSVSQQDSAALAARRSQIEYACQNVWENMRHPLPSSVISWAEYQKQVKDYLLAVLFNLYGERATEEATPLHNAARSAVQRGLYAVQQRVGTQMIDRHLKESVAAIYQREVQKLLGAPPLDVEHLPDGYVAQPAIAAMALQREAEKWQEEPEGTTVMAEAATAVGATQQSAQQAAKRQKLLRAMTAVHRKPIVEVPERQSQTYQELETLLGVYANCEVEPDFFPQHRPQVAWSMQRRKDVLVREVGIVQQGKLVDGSAGRGLTPLEKVAAASTMRWAYAHEDQPLTTEALKQLQRETGLMGRIVAEPAKLDDVMLVDMRAVSLYLGTIKVPGDAVVCVDTGCNRIMWSEKYLKRAVLGWQQPQGSQHEVHFADGASIQLSRAKHPVSMHWGCGEHLVSYLCRPMMIPGKAGMDALLDCSMLRAMGILIHTPTRSMLFPTAVKGEYQIVPLSAPSATAKDSRVQWSHWVRVLRQAEMLEDGDPYLPQHLMRCGDVHPNPGPEFCAFGASGDDRYQGRRTTQDQSSWRYPEAELNSILPLPHTEEDLLYLFPIDKALNPKQGISALFIGAGLLSQLEAGLQIGIHYKQVKVLEKMVEVGSMPGTTPTLVQQQLRDMHQRRPEQLPWSAIAEATVWANPLQHDAYNLTASYLMEHCGQLDMIGLEASCKGLSPLNQGGVGLDHEETGMLVPIAEALSGYQLLLAKARGIPEWWKARAQFFLLQENVVGGRYEQQSERVRVAYDFLNRVFGRPVFHQPQDCGEVTARGAKWWSTAFPHWFFAAVEAQFHQDLQESLTAEELVRRMTQGKCQVQQASSENPATLCGGRNRIGEPMRYFPKFPASPHTMSQTIRCRQHGQEKCPECQATADAEWMPGAGMLERVDPDPAEGPAGRFVQCPARIREAMMTGLDKGFATREQLGLTEEQQVQLLGNVCSVVSVKVMLLTAAAYSIHRKMLEEQRGQQGENLDSAYVQPEQQSVEEVKHMLQPAIDASAEQASAAVLSPLETLRRVDQRRVAARQQRNRQRNLYQKPALLTEAKRRKIAKVEKARREKERQAQRALQKHAMRQAEANADAIREERRDRKLRDRRQVQLVNAVLIQNLQCILMRQ